MEFTVPNFQLTLFSRVSYLLSRFEENYKLRSNFIVSREKGVLWFKGLPVAQCHLHFFSQVVKHSDFRCTSGSIKMIYNV